MAVNYMPMIYVPTMHGVRLFYKNYNVYRKWVYIFISSELLISITIPRFVALHLPVFEIHEVVYCCFTRTTLFTTMFTFMCSLKSMCIPSFVLIVVSVSYMPIYVPILMYCLRLFIVVLQELFT